MKKYILPFMLLLTLALSGCGFHLPRKNELPPQLHKLYIDSGKANSQLIATLAQVLESNHVQLVSKPQDAAVTLHMLNSRVNTDIPVIFNSTAATTYRYSIETQFQLEKASGHVITPPTHLVSQQSLSFNANQTAAPIITPLLRRELNRKLAQLILINLTSQSTQHQLARAFGETHAKRK